MWLWTVALHVCYRCLTLSLTTVKSWMDWGYMWGCHSAQTRPCLVKPPYIASPKLRTAGLSCLKIEWTNLIPVQDWGFIWGVVTPKDLVWDDKTPLQNHENIWKILRKNLNFVVKKDIWCSIVDIIFLNNINWLVIAR